MPPRRLRLTGSPLPVLSHAACMHAHLCMPMLPPAQVSTRDGRVRIFGREGVERSLARNGCGSGSGLPPQPSRQLFFLSNRGAVARLDQVKYRLKIGIAAPYHTIPYHTIPYHTIPYHTIPYHTIPYHTIPYPPSRIDAAAGWPAAAVAHRASRRPRQRRRRPRGRSSGGSSSERTASGRAAPWAQQRSDHTRAALGTGALSSPGMRQRRRARRGDGQRVRDPGYRGAPSAGPNAHALFK
jgi:hypothetical protein